MPMGKAVLLACVLLALNVPARAQDRATVQTLNEGLMTAFNKAGAAGVGAFYTQDAILLPEGSPIVKGNAAVEAYWKAAAKTAGEMVLDTVTITSLGPDAASDIGTWRLKTKARKPHKMSGKYLVIL